MATFLLLGTYTHQGMEKIRGAPARIDTAREVIDNSSAKLLGWYVTMGQYDFAALVEAPSDEVMARLSLAMSSHGNIHTQTLRAFTEQEFRDIVNALPY
ncbi:MAG: GYD domain-containing protein [Anaerolineales bacterium]|nr:GYD domain-containing protein [Anaerolineales bacterium]